MTKNTKPFVRIQSNITINVTAGLQNQDVTNKDAHIPDRLKVNPLWPKMTCLIRAGAGIYPSDIAEWDSVKALANDKVLTIGEYLDSADDSGAEKKKEELKMALEEIKAAKSKSLADLAGE